MAAVLLLVEAIKPTQGVVAVETRHLLARHFLAIAIAATATTDASAAAATVTTVYPLQLIAAAHPLPATVYPLQLIATAYPLQFIAAADFLIYV